MVMLAEKMRQKLLSGSSSQTGAVNDEEMGSKEEMQDWLLSVGIISPVTKESAGALYHQQLSRQVIFPSPLCVCITSFFALSFSFGTFTNGVCFMANFSIFLSTL